MTGTVVIPQGRPFTVADLEATPDDGNRYELTDGMLTVTPAPGWAHQEVSLALALRSTCPPRLRVLVAPFAVRTSTDSEVLGEEQFHAARPFPVSVTPTRLLDGLRPR